MPQDSTVPYHKAGPGGPVVCYIYRDPRFDKAMVDLNRKGGTASFITEKAEKMIKDLTECRRRLSEIGKKTRNGEHRLERCFKFDLGSGYRMVCLRFDACIVFLYIGTHDDCCRWIEHNKRMKYEIGNERHGVPILEKGHSDDNLSENILEERKFISEYEKSIMNRLDDDILKKILFGDGR